MTLCRNMIRPEYWKVCPFVHHEEKHYLRKIEEESDEIFQQLKGSQHNMYLKGKLLSQIYEELKELCHKPDMELLQVRTEDWRFMVLLGQYPPFLGPSCAFLSCFLML